VEGQERLSVEDASLVTAVLANMPGQNWQHAEKYPKCTRTKIDFDEIFNALFKAPKAAVDVDMPMDDICSDVGLDFKGVSQYTYLNEYTLVGEDAAAAPHAPVTQAMDRSVPEAV
jgi:hypothetical protein